MTASRILVVDDEADIRGLLKEILSEEGYDVEIAADASQARSSRAAQVPDLVLLDIWMPDTDGITLLREWSVTDGYDCPVVDDVRPRYGRDGGGGHAAWRVRFRREAAQLDQTAAHRGTSARCRAPQTPLGPQPRVGTGRAHRQGKKHADAARTSAAGCRQLVPGIAHRRIGIRTRGVCALPAFLERPRSQAVFHRGCGEPWAGSGGRAVRQRTRRQSRARRIRSGGRRFAVLERPGGFEQRGATRPGRRHRAERLHPRGRPAANRTQRTMDQFRPGRIRIECRRASRCAAICSRT